MKFIAVLCAVLLCSSSVAAERLRFVAENLPPFHYLDNNNQPRGALVDVVQAVLRESGLTGEIQLEPLARALHDIQTQQNVFMFSLLKTEERSQDFVWVGQTYQAKAYLVGLADRPELKLLSLEQAKQFRVATIRGYHSETFLREHAFNEAQNLLLSVNSQQLWQQLFKGRSDLVLTNFIGLHQEIESSGFDANKVVPYFHIDHFPDQLFIAGNLSNDATVIARLRAALDKIKQSGEYQSIIKRWNLPS